MNMLSQSELKKQLSYSKETGIFTRLVSNTPTVSVGDVAGSKETHPETGKTYVRVRVNNKRYLAHKLAWFYSYGKWPTNLIDHIDGDSTNNRIDNLRQASPQENCRNRRMPVNNTSGFCGVVWHKRDHVWQASIRLGGNVKKHLGCYRHIGDAIKARKEALINYGFHRNHGTSRPL